MSVLLHESQTHGMAETITEKLQTFITQNATKMV